MLSDIKKVVPTDKGRSPRLNAYLVDACLIESQLKDTIQPMFTTYYNLCFTKPN